MGKKKVTDKDIRSIEFAIDSTFIGSSEKAAKQAFHSLVEQAEEAVRLQNDLNSLRHEFNTLKGEYKKVSHRFSKFRKLCHAMARKEIVDADGEPILFGDILYLNVSGAAKQVTRVLLNVNGTAQEALVKANP